MKYALFAVLLALTACGGNPALDSADGQSLGNSPIDPLSLNYSEMGKQYLQRGKYDVALVRLQKALAVDRRNIDAHHTLALLYERLDRRVDAERSYRNALQLNPQESSLLNNFGRFLCQAGRVAEAQQLFSRALLNPLYKTPELIHTNAGLCAQMHQQTVQAETHFRRALSSEGQLTAASIQARQVALFQMAQLSYDQGRYAEAFDYIKRHLSQTQSPQALLLGIHIARQVGDSNREAGYAQLLRSKFPDSEEIQTLRNIR